MGKSSKDKRDAYYRLAKEQGWRARSAFKLIQLDEQFDLFANCTRVVDLCAAPGSWSQVLSRVLVKGEKFGRRAWIEKQERERKMIWKGFEKIPPNPVGDEEVNGGGEPLPEKVGLDADSNEAKHHHRPAQETMSPPRIVAIDLQPLAPLDGITVLQGDITHPSTIPRILSALNPSPSPTSSSNSTPNPQSNQIDLLLSDGAPDITGLHDLDAHLSSQLLHSALHLALLILKPGTGKFVSKIFCPAGGKGDGWVLARLGVFFEAVSVIKPRSSRGGSREAFVVGLGFKGVPRGWRVGELGGSEALLERVSDSGGAGVGEGIEMGERDDGWIGPFVACGDLTGWDSRARRGGLDPGKSDDREGDLQEKKKVEEEKEQEPNYKRMLEERRRNRGLMEAGKGKVDTRW